MAAGLGTRLMPFTELMPKPFLPVMGVPAAQFALDLVREFGIENGMINFHHLPKVSKQQIASLDWPRSTSLLLSDESRELLGSGGGLTRASHFFKGAPFFFLNTDTLCNAPLAELASTHLRLRSAWNVSLTLLIRKQSSGTEKYREMICEKGKAEGLLQSFGELKPNTSFFTGVGILEAQAVSHLSPDRPADFIKDILEPALALKRVGFLQTRCAWHDLGTPKLWADIHFDWIQALETGSLPNRWRKRIEQVATRVAPMIWSKKNAHFRASAPEWISPAYVDLDKPISGTVGPFTIVYGDRVLASHSINYFGKSAKI